MAARPRLRATLVKCGSCGKRYSNPLTHVCTPRAGRGRGRAKFAPRVAASFTCPSCGKAAGNPLTHVCQSKRGDFRRRKKAAAKAAAQAARDAGKHDYDACPDGEDCTRYPCRVYREGYQRGREDGEAAGFAAGQAVAAKE